MERRTSPGGVRRRGARRFLAATVAGLTATTVLTVAPASASPAGTAAPSSVFSVADATVAAEQVLTWTADNSVTDYKAFPATAEAGPATIVFENSMATGSTFGMSHTLTFDTSSPGYNHDVNLNILASPFDANGGRHEAQ
ncbi:MAG: OmpL47-type beta-barrel domain-containing protein, partial [Cellulosimicrobium funkei]